MRRPITPVGASRTTAGKKNVGAPGGATGVGDGGFFGKHRHAQGQGQDDDAGEKPAEEHGQRYHAAIAGGKPVGGDGAN